MIITNSPISIITHNFRNPVFDVVLSTTMNSHDRNMSVIKPAIIMKAKRINSIFASPNASTAKVAIFVGLLYAVINSIKKHKHVPYIMATITTTPAFNRLTVGLSTVTMLLLKRKNP